MGLGGGALVMEARGGGERRSLLYQQWLAAGGCWALQPGCVEAGMLRQELCCARGMH